MAKMGIYPSYLFKDHDPILDVVDTIVKDSGKSIVQAHEISNVSVSTLASWRKRKTKRPQFATVAAVITALGGEVNIKYKGRKVNW